MKIIDSIKKALAIKDLWMPSEKTIVFNKSENEALLNMYNMFMEISKNSGWNIIKKVDLPDTEKVVIFAFMPKNKNCWRVTVGYYQKYFNEFKGPAWRDNLRNAYYFDDSWEDESICPEDVIKWMDLPKI